MAADTTAEHPWPVRLLSKKIADYVDRMSVVWVEGQMVQLNRRPGAKTAYLTLRDPDVDMSLSVSIRVTALDAMGPALKAGSRVVVQAKPTFWVGRGSLQLDARQIRPVGEGELLARIEYLKRTLSAEGLFAPERKRPLPFLPRVIGLICGRNSAAEKDVVENARRRWPGARFEIREVAVQGVNAVTEVVGALGDLDGADGIDVIVIARGGGSVEDLLPFSNETMLRAVSRARTPVVSAIGHDVDTPLLDLVADHRASTPTDAAKAIVPDAAAERATIVDRRARARVVMTRRVEQERHRLTALTSRPVLADRSAVIHGQRGIVTDLRARAHRAAIVQVGRARDRVVHLAAQLRVLSPQSTLDRGYAIVTRPDGHIVASAARVTADEPLQVRVADGAFAVRVDGSRLR
ncbi:exodeoxyribonuclease VII large subunit [Kribbia dieselivorans]|uniref:exodeoxyribonuclease VII large subunit n=1 Tax=Kribbia dieselivorans TaxID=331526 RepID=UPI000838D3DF|nr:exodeoxyribonuclease VII large subunit [Kribbia dieselivorans]